MLTVEIEVNGDSKSTNKRGSSFGWFVGLVVRNEASTLASFSITKRNEPAYSRTCKDRSEANHAYSTP
jgi:hypothetical protein